MSSSLGDDDNNGTQSSPVKTVSRGVDLAKAPEGARRVYVCEGTYPEAIVLPGGISLFGGFECPDVDGWKYAGFDKRAVLHAPPGPIALVLEEAKAIEEEELSFICDLKVVASDAAEPGGSSIAVLARPGSRAHFPRLELVAGNGADGVDGADGSPGGLPAPAGHNGNNGANACSYDIGVGGPAAITQCEDGTQSMSGLGGSGNKLAANDGLGGLWPPAPGPDGYGAGGNGESVAIGMLCTPGIGGAHGADGFHGFGAFGVGRLTGEGYFGVRGDDGQPGLPGQGGGGGGAALGALCPGPLFGGSGGGSGGSGGCGGKGGNGGQPGGSSIGLGLLGAGISAGMLIITTGNGGNAGDGGKLQSGGLGGLPGYGGIGVGGVGGAKDGCGGGLGGNGGKGGNGGGGQGGHSLPIARTSDFTLVYVDIDTTIGKKGLGGLGGDPGAAAAIGENGIATMVGDLDP